MSQSELLEKAIAERTTSSGSTRAVRVVLDGQRALESNTETPFFQGPAA